MWNEKAFSLIELMVTVAIIGVLAGMAVPNYSLTVHRTRVKLTISQMIQLRNGIIGLREIENDILSGITGTGCTYCSFASVGTNANSWSPDATAIARFNRAGFSGAQRDAWGNYLILNENEREYADCRQDMITSVGGNGIWDGTGTMTVFDFAVVDDIMLLVPIKTNMPGCTEIKNVLVGPQAFDLPN